MEVCEICHHFGHSYKLCGSSKYHCIKCGLYGHLSCSNDLRQRVKCKICGSLTEHLSNCKYKGLVMIKRAVKRPNPELNKYLINKK